MIKQRFSILGFCLFFSAILWGDPEVPGIVAAQEGDPSAIVAGKVNAITGDCVMSDEDLVVRGAVPLILRKTYVSGNGKSVDTGWHFFPHFIAQGYPLKDRRSIALYVPESTGAVLRYTTLRYHKHWEELEPIIESHAIGVANNSSGVITGRTNLKNNRVFFDCGTHSRQMQLYTVNGEGLRRYYKRWRFSHSKGCDQFVLTKEELPNGCWILYESKDEGRPTFVKVVNPGENKTFAWARFHYFGVEDDNRNCRIETSDGRALEYVFEKRNTGKKHKHRFYLREVKGSVAFNKFYVPTSPPAHFHSLLGEVRYGNAEQCRFTYHYDKTDSPISNRVKEIFETDANGKMVRTHEIDYKLAKWKDSEHGFEGHGETTVRSADGLKEVILWTKEMRPTEYKFFEGDTFLSSHRLIWGREKSHLTGVLKAKSLCGTHGSVFSRVFEYDGNFNVTKDTLHGNLSGMSGGHSINEEARVQGGERYDRHYVYSGDGKNLTLEEREENGRVVRYHYLPGTSLMTAELVGDAHRIWKRRFFEYDGDHLLTKEIADNGSSHDPNNFSDVTQRAIKKIYRRPDGMVERVEDWYYEPREQREKLLSKQCLHYDNLLLVKEDHFDARGEGVFSIHYQYDHLGRVVAKTDPLGRKEEFSYDELGRVKESRHVAGFRTCQHYSKGGHLIGAQEIGADGQVHTETYGYTTCGRNDSTTDYLGNTTANQYDPLGRKKTTRYPDGASEHFVYDEKGCVVRQVARSGAETKASYNAYGHPIEIHHPDGSRERFIYHYDGKLKEKIDARGAIHRFHYDALGHVVHAQVSSQGGELLQENRWTYDGDLLKECIDAEGGVQRYQYDGAGRKIAEQKDDAWTTFAYDAMGRLALIEDEDGKQELSYDLLGQLICQRTLAKGGSLIKEERYAYDELGNKTRVQRGGALEQFFYDGLSRLTSTIDPTGVTTRFSYDESNRHTLKKTKIDALGTQWVELFGSMGEKRKTEVFSSSGALQYREECDYDASGNCTTSTAHTPRGVITTTRSFDALGNLTQLKEGFGSPQEKTTRYTYHPGKLLAEVQKNDGEVLYYNYDVLGRLAECHAKSGDGYRYSYDKLGRAIAVEDLATGMISRRVYAAGSELMSEEFLHGLSVHYLRDAKDRVINFSLPDKTSVSYEWDAGLLRKVARLGEQGNVRYERVCLKRDEACRPVASSLPMNAGTEMKTYDLAGRMNRVRVGGYEEVVLSRNPMGYAQLVENPFGRIDFSYDDTHQIKQENGPLFRNDFAFDAQGVLLKLNGQETKSNALYQIEQIERRQLTYDSSGRLSCDGEKLYSYDAFDRLIRVEEPKKYRAEYIYDSWHRRMQTLFYIWHDGKWILGKARFYLYDGFREIGSCDEKGQMIDFRVLGSTSGAELGTTIALEVHNRIFVPIHDLRGNITQLLCPKDPRLNETYLYSAFGKVRYFKAKGEEVGGSFVGNPWFFCAKRQDEETGLVYFGRRYYHPELCSWITPDPLGAIDRPNLYSFLRANPMVFFDAVGFNSEERDVALKMRHDWQNTSTGFTRGTAFALTEAVKPVGYTLYYGAYHLPLPYVRDTLVNTGGFLTQNPDLRAHHSKIFHYPGSGANPNPRLSLMYFNGVLNTQRDVEATCGYLSQKLGGQSIDACYSSTRGAPIDLMDCARLWCGVNTHAVDIGYRLITSRYDQMKAAYPDGKFLLGGLIHSRGNLSMSLILDRIERDRPEIRHHLRFRAYGCPKSYGAGMGVDLSIVNSRGDGVAALDFIGLIRRDPQVRWVDSKGSIFPFDHAILGPTYRWQIDDHFKEIIDEINGWGL